jgi:hypothetical protein
MVNYELPSYFWPSRGCLLLTVDCLVNLKPVELAGLPASAHHHKMSTPKGKEETSLLSQWFVM